MMQTRLNFFILINLFIFGFVIKTTAQQDAAAIIAKVFEGSSKVSSFEADVRIDVDVDFIRIPVKNGRVFFKAPDKFRFRATGFVLVPKKGLNFSVIEMLNAQHTAIYAGEDENHFLLKIVPMTDDADFVIAGVWVEKTTNRLSKMDVTTKGQGNYLMEFTYGNIGYDLPVTTKVSFDIEQVDIPMKFLGNLKVDQKKVGDRSKGSVSLHYSNFEINGEIPDVVFEDEEDQVN